MSQDNDFKNEIQKEFSENSGTCETTFKTENTISKRITSKTLPKVRSTKEEKNAKKLTKNDEKDSDILFDTPISIPIGKDLSRKARSFMITLKYQNNAVRPELPYKKLKYYVYQLEKGKSGTPHWQIFITFFHPKTFRYVIELISEAHIEVVNDRIACIKYCIKNEARISDPCYSNTNLLMTSVSNKESNIKSLLDAIDLGATEEDICAKYPDYYLKYFFAIKRIISEKQQNKLDTVLQQKRLIILTGDLGVGKTSFVYKYFGQDSIFNKGPGKWFDGYNKEKVILIDNFDKKDIPLNLLLEMTDKAFVLAQTKGGRIIVNPQTIILTSSSSINSWYPTKQGSENPFLMFINRAQIYYNIRICGYNVELVAIKEKPADYEFRYAIKKHLGIIAYIRNKFKLKDQASGYIKTYRISPLKYPYPQIR